MSHIQWNLGIIFNMPDAILTLILVLQYIKFYFIYKYLLIIPLPFIKKTQNDHFLVARTKWKAFLPSKHIHIFSNVFTWIAEFSSKKYIFLELSLEKLTHGCTTFCLCRQHFHGFTCSQGFLMRERRDSKEKKMLRMAFNQYLA